MAIMMMIATTRLFPSKSLMSVPGAWHFAQIQYLWNVTDALKAMEATTTTTIGRQFLHHPPIGMNNIRRFILFQS